MDFITKSPDPAIINSDSIDQLIAYRYELEQYRLTVINPKAKHRLYLEWERVHKFIKKHS